MANNNKCTKKLFSIFEKGKWGKKIAELRQDDNVRTTNLKKNLPARRSTRLKTEIVESIPVESSGKHVYDFEDSNLIFNQQQKKLKSNSFEERLDKMFNHESVSLSMERTSSISTTNKKVVENKKPEEEKTKISNRAIDSINMLSRTKFVNTISELHNKNSRIPRERKIRRYTISNVNSTDNAAVSEEILNVEDQNDTVKINRDAQALKRKPTEYENSIENKNTNRTSTCELQEAKKHDENLDSAINIPHRSPKLGSRQSARIRERRLTISNIILDGDNLEDTNSNIEYSREKTICKAKEIPEKSDANYQTGSVEINKNKQINNTTSHLNDKNEVIKENVNTSLIIGIDVNSEANTELQRKKENSSKKVLKENEASQGLKRKRGRPRTVLKSPKLVAKKLKKSQNRKVNIPKEPKNTYKKLLKENFSSVNIRKIPQDRLDDVLDMLANEDHPFWNDRNISCNASIHHYWETRTIVSDQNMKMKYARQFLLRRDWLSLSKILCLSSHDTMKNNYYPLLVKYATLCLAHTDKEQFHKFIKSLISINDSNAIIKKCTKISPNNEGINLG